MVNLTAIFVTAAFVFVGLVVCVIWERMSAREVKKYEAKIKKMEPELDESEKAIS